MAFTAALGLGVYDAWLTHRRMRKYGILVETNPVVQWFAGNAAGFGVYFSTLVPTVALGLFAMLAQSSLLMGMVLGARLCLFDFQLESLKLERDFDAARAARAGGPPSSTGGSHE